MRLLYAEDEPAMSGNADVGTSSFTMTGGTLTALTGDCTITSLTNEGTISFNGYTITLADGTVLSE